MLRLPTLGLPLTDDVDETGTARMAIAAEVVLVWAFALHPVPLGLHVHEPRAPVAKLRLTLPPPVRPDPELRVANPVGHAVVPCQRVPIGLNRQPGIRPHRWQVRRCCGRGPQK